MATSKPSTKKPAARKKATPDQEAPPAPLPGFTAPKVFNEDDWIEKPVKLSPFDFLKAINESKVNLMAENPGVEKDYPRFLIARGLSYFSDTVKAANMLNERDGSMTNRQHFEFLLSVVSPRKRFSEWFKSIPDAAVDVIAQYYECSKAKARQIAPLHTTEDLEHMRARMNVGGRV